MSVKEKLKNILILNQQDSIEFIISKYLLVDNLSKIPPTSSELSKILNIHKSTLTQFAKKNGYAGYKEMIIRLMVENELYIAKVENNKSILSKKENILIEFNDDISEYAPYLSRFAQMIKIANTVFKSDKLLFIISF